MLLLLWQRPRGSRSCQTTRRRVLVTLLLLARLHGQTAGAAAASCASGRCERRRQILARTHRLAPNQGSTCSMQSALIRHFSHQSLSLIVNAIAAHPIGSWSSCRESGTSESDHAAQPLRTFSATFYVAWRAAGAPLTTPSTDERTELTWPCVQSDAVACVVSDLPQRGPPRAILVPHLESRALRCGAQKSVTAFHCVAAGFLLSLSEHDAHPRDQHVHLQTQLCARQTPPSLVEHRQTVQS